jgi:hypothetical protein
MQIVQLLRQFPLTPNIEVIISELPKRVRPTPMQLARNYLLEHLQGYGQAAALWFA